MGYRKVSIGAATLMVDEETGAVLAKLTGTIEADVVEVDVEAIVDGVVEGVAGAVPKTQKDLDDRLAAVLAKLSADPATQTTLAALLTQLQATDLVVSASYALTIPAAASKTLAELGATIPATVRALLLMRADGTGTVVYVNLAGEASALTTILLPVDVVHARLSLTKAVADLLELYAATETKASLFVLTPRG